MEDHQALGIGHGLQATGHSRCLVGATRCGWSLMGTLWMALEATLEHGRCSGDQQCYVDVADSSASKVPPPKLRRSGTMPPTVTLTAQYLNSGIFPNGSSTGLVRRLAAAS